MSKKFRPHPVGLQGGAPARHTAQGIGKVEVLSGTTLPQIRTPIPSSRSMWRSMTSARRWLSSARTSRCWKPNLTTSPRVSMQRMHKLIMGIQYLGRMVTGTEWLVIGDPDTAKRRGCRNMHRSGSSRRI